MTFYKIAALTPPISPSETTQKGTETKLHNVGCCYAKMMLLPGNAKEISERFVRFIIHSYAKHFMTKYQSKMTADMLNRRSQGHVYCEHYIDNPKVDDTSIIATTISFRDGDTPKIQSHGILIEKDHRQGPEDWLSIAKNGPCHVICDGVGSSGPEAGAWAQQVACTFSEIYDDNKAAFDQELASDSPQEALWMMLASSFSSLCTQLETDLAKLSIKEKKNLMNQKIWPATTLSIGLIGKAFHLFQAGDSPSYVLTKSGDTADCKRSTDTTTKDPEGWQDIAFQLSEVYFYTILETPRQATIREKLQRRFSSNAVKLTNKEIKVSSPADALYRFAKSMGYKGDFDIAALKDFYLNLSGCTQRFTLGKESVIVMGSDPLGDNEPNDPNIRYETVSKISEQFLDIRRWIDESVTYNAPPAS